MSDAIGRQLDLLTRFLELPPEQQDLILQKMNEMIKEGKCEKQS